MPGELVALIGRVVAQPPGQLELACPLVLGGIGLGIAGRAGQQTGQIDEQQDGDQGGGSAQQEVAQGPQQGGAGPQRSGQPPEQRGQGQQGTEVTPGIASEQNFFLAGDQLEQVAFRDRKRVV